MAEGIFVLLCFMHLESVVVFYGDAVRWRGQFILFVLVRTIVCGSSTVEKPTLDKGLEKFMSDFADF
jgi:hypothetical protein